MDSRKTTDESRAGQVATVPSPEVQAKRVSLDPQQRRRSFLRGVGGAGLVALVLQRFTEGEARAHTTPRRATSDELPPAPPRCAEDEVEHESLLLRMQEDLRRALAKPPEERNWVMVIDQRKCVGCHGCTISCIAENKLPPGVVYRPVIDEEVGEYPNVRRRFTPRPCMQCDEPPCVPVCPVSATYKRPDGIVAIDYDVCIGCRYCITACPYNARTFDFGDCYNPLEDEQKAAEAVGFAATTPYEQTLSFEYGKAWPREPDESPIGNVRKCQFCAHRLEAGMLPACTTTCIGAATLFGDANDAESLVSGLIGLPNAMRIKEHVGTEPSVYYLT